MSEILAMYKWSLIAGSVASGALALIGAQVAGRNQSVQSLVISQAASLGVIAAMAVHTFLGFAHEHPHQTPGIFPLLCGLGFSALAYLACEYLILHRWSSRNTYYIGIFGLLMAATYCLIALIPGLESHMASSYFGDLTVASNSESMIVGAIATVALFLVAARWKQITNWSFESMIYGSFVRSSELTRANRAFTLASLVMIAASVQFLGLLFTICSLFLPSMILTKMQDSQRGLVLKLVLAGVTGTATGITASIAHGSLPTVPTVAFALVVASLIIGLPGRRSA